MASKIVEEHKYGWVICISCALLLFCTGGLGTTGFSAYQPYLLSMRGLSNTQSSTMLMIRSLFSLLGMAITTKMITKFGVRRLITGAMALDAAAFLIYAFVPGWPGCYLGAALCGAALGTGGMVPASILISRWFNEHRGLALGICMSATGLSAFAASPAILFLVERFSLRTAFVVEAIFILAATLIVYTFTYSNPSCLNTVPVGEKKEEESLISRTFAAHTTDKLLMILFMLGILIFGMPANTLYSHISVLYSGEGFSPRQVSVLVSIMGLSLASGKCAYGWIADRIGMMKASGLLYVMTSAGALLCTLAGNGSFAVAAAAVILMSFGLAVTSVSISMYSSKVATEEEYNNTVTILQFLSALGGLLFGKIPGMVADYTGSYIPAYLVMFILSAAGALVTTQVYRRIRHEDHIYVRTHLRGSVNLLQLR